MRDISIFQGVKELKAERHFRFYDLGRMWRVHVLRGDAFPQCGFLEKLSRESNKSLYARAENFFLRWNA